MAEEIPKRCSISTLNKSVDSFIPTVALHFSIYGYMYIYNNIMFINHSLTNLTFTIDIIISGISMLTTHSLTHSLTHLEIIFVYINKN